MSVSVAVRAEEKRHVYRFVSLKSLLEQNITGADGEPIVTVNELEPASQLAVAPVQFGDITQPDFDCTEYPTGWNPGAIPLPPIKIYKIRDAIVHSERGFVTTGDYFIADAMKLPGFKNSILRWAGRELISLPDREPRISLGNAAHIFCGSPGNRNYSHFLLDILTASFVPPVSSAFENMAVLLPQIRAKYQLEYLSYFPELFNRAAFVTDGCPVHCHTLSISTLGINNEHYGPNPHHVKVARLIRARILARASPAKSTPARIYINRGDSGARRLLNEAEVVACVERHGFTSVTLTGLSVAEQVGLLANATHIIAPHGAGNTNIIFCNPGTKFLELLQDSYVKWSMRLINSLVPVVYGCVIGRDAGAEPEIWRRNWTIDITKLERAISQMLG